MKKISFLLILSAQILHAQNMDLFNKFHEYFAKNDWKKMEKLIADDFQLIDWNNKVVDYKAAYVDYMKNWNGTMGTTWRVFNSEEKDGKVYSAERDSDIFLYTFYELPATFTFVYEFKNNQMYRLSYDTLPGYQKHLDTFNFNIENFFLWVKNNQPQEIENLVSSDYKTSAKAYLKVIKLWKDR